MQFTLPTIDPDDAPDIHAIINRDLEKASALNSVPTPVDDLLEALGIQRIQGLEDIFNRKVKLLLDAQQRSWQAKWRKIHGLASPKDRLIYTPSLGNAGRDHFRDVHELFHVSCPWHLIRNDILYWENHCTLSHTARRRLEVEANYAGGRYLFQRAVFVPDANSIVVDFDSVSLLASRYMGSAQATFRHFVEVQTSACVGISYLTNNFRSEEDGFSPLHKPMMFRSQAFENLYPDWTPPLLAPHCWREAFVENEVQSGQGVITQGATPSIFNWHTFWNGHALLVLAEPVMMAPRRRVVLPSTSNSRVPAHS